jgi:hypothetical protein
VAAKSIRVRGVTYTNPDEARVAAEEIRHRADELAEQLRFDGKDGEADQLQDRGRADAARLLEWARDFEAAEAGRTEQPPDTPRPRKPSRRSASHASRGDRRRRVARPRTGTRRASTPKLTPQTRTLIRGTGIPAATSSATSLALQVAGLTIGVAFLTLLLTDRGVSAFSGLAGGLAGGIAWIIDPVDPLAPRNDFTTPRSSAPNGGDFPTARTTAAVRSSQPRQLTTMPLAVGVG